MKQMQEEKSADMIKMQEITVMLKEKEEQGKKNREMQLKLQDMEKKMKACKWCLMKLWEETHNF